MCACFGGCVYSVQYSCVPVLIPAVWCAHLWRWCGGWRWLHTAGNSLQGETGNLQHPLGSCLVGSLHCSPHRGIEEMVGKLDTRKYFLMHLKDYLSHETWAKSQRNSLKYSWLLARNHVEMAAAKILQQRTTGLQNMEKLTFTIKHNFRYFQPSTFFPMF